MYKKKSEGWLKHIDFLIIDLLCFHMAYWGSYILRHGWGNPYEIIMYRNLAIVASFIVFFVIACTESFSGVLRRNHSKELVSTIKTVLYVMAIVIAYLFAIQQGGDFSRIVLGGTTVGYFGSAYLFRTLWKTVLLKKNASSENVKKLIVITSSGRAEEMIGELTLHKLQDPVVSGVALVDCYGTIGDSHYIKGIRVVANSSNIIDYLTHEWTDEVLLDIDENDPDCYEIRNTIMEMGLVTHIRIGDKLDYLGKDKQIQYLGDYPVVTVGMKFLTSGQVLIKRLFDLIGALIGCVFTLILIIILGPAIFIKSPGNIFFSQVRIGKNGKPFKMYKFRSMYPDADSHKNDLAGLNTHQDGMMFKVDNDPRIIGNRKRPGKGIGYFIRKTSIDEFPQFFNVLIGNMSLVGTRPPTPDEWEKYEARHRSRMSVRPGITGLWQVSGRSDIMDFEEVVKLDREYIENWSVFMDITIILKTIGVVLRGKGTG